eukprot:766605-Hanusia_phi.AAC.8
MRNNATRSALRRTFLLEARAHVPGCLTSQELDRLQEVIQQGRAGEGEENRSEERRSEESRREKSGREGSRRKESGEWGRRGGSTEETEESSESSAAGWSEKEGRQGSERRGGLRGERERIGGRG